jgi:hypothetical protein
VRGEGRRGLGAAGGGGGGGLRAVGVQAEVGVDVGLACGGIGLRVTAERGGGVDGVAVGIHGVAVLCGVLRFGIDRAQ